jgi:hypothetical protein
VKEIKSKPKAKDAEDRRFQFKLDDEVFTATLPVDDADFTLEFSEVTTVALSSDADINSPEAQAFIARFLTCTMGVNEYRRLRYHLRQQFEGEGTSNDTLLDVMLLIQEWIQEGTEEDTNRPTKPSSSSSGGRRPPKDKRVSDLAALAGGDAEIFVITDAQAKEETPARQTTRTQRRTSSSRRRAG